MQATPQAADLTCRQQVTGHLLDSQPHSWLQDGNAEIHGSLCSNDLFKMTWFCWGYDEPIFGPNSIQS